MLHPTDSSPKSRSCASDSPVRSLSVRPARLGPRLGGLGTPITQAERSLGARGVLTAGPRASLGPTHSNHGVGAPRTGAAAKKMISDLTTGTCCHGPERARGALRPFFYRPRRRSGAPVPRTTTGRTASLLSRRRYKCTRRGRACAGTATTARGVDARCMARGRGPAGRG